MYNDKTLCEHIGYSFSDMSLLTLALTHSSHANERNRSSESYNERLEFLGDSVLSIVVSEYLYQHYPKLPEGELTKIRALVVCEPTLADIALNFELGMYMHFGKGEILTGGRVRISILADALEALIAAIYLDGGLLPARTFILTFFKEKIKLAVAGKIFLDYKTALQEKIQATSQKDICYIITDEKGPDHKKEFYAQVNIGDSMYGEGIGKSKKEAEQVAAKQALSRFL